MRSMGYSANPHRDLLLIYNCLPDVPGRVVGDRGYALDSFHTLIWDMGARPAISPQRTDAPVACPPWIYNNRYLVENL